MFERFSTDARRVVVLAQEEARGLGHDYIGTEHIVLALLADGIKTVAGDVLAGAGITRERFHHEVLAIVGPGEGAPSGHIPFTPRSKKVLELSLREALRLGSKSIGTEHILLGIIREGEGLACQILVALGADLGALRDLTEARATVDEQRRRRWFRNPDPRAAPTAMTAGAAKAADRAVERAGGQPVASHHYLLGLLDDDDSLAARILSALGVSREVVEAKLTELGPEGTSDEPPERAGARRTSLGVEGGAISIRIDEPDLASRLRDQLTRNQTEILRGLDVPGSERIWQAVLPAVREAIEKLESSAAAGEWTPPGWSEEGVAAYAVASTAAGTTTRLWVAEGVDEDEVRRWLVGWLAAKAPDADECATFTVVLDRVDGDLTVVGWGFGRSTQEPGVPFADLVAAAIRDLERAA